MKLRAGWEHERIDPPIPWAAYALIVAATVLVTALLSGCGGGGSEDEDDGQSTTQPVDCKATPEKCK